MFDVLSNFMLFYCEISLLCDLRCFVAKSVLSRFTRFGVEKKGQISGMGGGVKGRLELFRKFIRFCSATCPLL